MNEVTLVVTKEEYLELLQAKIRLDWILEYLEERGDSYINDDLIRRYAGYKKKEDAGE